MATTVPNRSPLIVSPHLYLADVTGRPLDYGRVYFGEPNKDGEFYPINIFSDKELTEPLAQPVHTKGGFLHNNGDITEVFAYEGTYSVKVLDQYGRKIFFKGEVAKQTIEDATSDVVDAAQVEINKRMVELDEVINTAAAAGAGANGWTADLIVDGTQVQTQINLYGAKTYDIPAGGYPVGGLVLLDNGDIVKSTIPNNINNPNTDMMGWYLVSNVRTPSALDSKKVRGDGVSSDSVGIQEYFRATDDNRKASIFFPLRDNNYLVTTPVVIQEPTMIFGDVGATYNRGIGKTGKILIDNGTDYAFNLGNEREWSNTTQNIDSKLSKNPADHWTIKNINFGRASNVTGLTKSAIKHTTKTDGPDRGFIMSEVGGVNLRHVLHITDQGKSTQIASVVIEKCVLSNCALPVKVDGRAFNFRFVGNQAEQNTEGAVHGCLDGAITIEDNMLEGQKNPINIYPLPLTGNTPKISFKANYLEAMTGDYIVKAEATYGGTLEVANNYTQYNSANDPILLKGAWDYIKNTDNFAMTFDTQYFVKSGSLISFNKKFKVYQKNTGSLSNKIVHVIDDLPQSTGYTTTPLVNAENVIKTKLGSFNYRNSMNSITPIPLAVAAQDVVCLNVVYYDELISDVSSAHYVYNSNNSASLAEGTLFHEAGNGLIKVATFHFVVGDASSSINFRAVGLTTSYVLGISAKVIGNATANPNARFNTEASAPKLKRIDEPFVYTELYNPPSIPANGAITKTLTPFYGIRTNLAQRVFAHFSVFDAGVEVTARITANDTVVVTLKNTTGAAIDLAEGTLTLQLFSAPI